MKHSIKGKSDRARASQKLEVMHIGIVCPLFVDMVGALFRFSDKLCSCFRSVSILLDFNGIIADI